MTAFGSPLGAGLSSQFATLAPPLATLGQQGRCPPLPPLPGPLVHLDAFRIAQADNTLVTDWPNLVGSGDAVASSGVAPTFYKTTAAKLINGLPAVSFDGSDDVMTCSAGGTWLGLAAVILPTSVASQVLCASATNTSTTLWDIQFDTANAYIQDGNPLLTKSATFPVDGSAHLLVINRTSSIGPAFWVDGTKTGFTLPNGNNASAGIILGGYAGSTSPFYNGLIGEFILWQSTLGDTQAARIHAALSCKWGTP